MDGAMYFQAQGIEAKATKEWLKKHIKVLEWPSSLQTLIS